MGFSGGASGKKKKKKLAANAGDWRDTDGFDPWVWKSPGEGTGNPL